MRHESESEWKQHFPTYRFKERDIAIEEYKVAAKALEAEERIFLYTSNAVILASAGIGSLAIGSLKKLYGLYPSVPPIVLIGLLIALTLALSWSTLRFMADRQKSIVFAARKVIVLRRMLGLNFGNIQLVLPNWRIEGADNPFAIRMFPGWSSYAVFPLYSIVAISAVVLFLLGAAFTNLPANITKSAPLTWQQALFIPITWSIFLFYSYRKALFDAHESFMLLLAKILAKILNVKLLENFENILYRANLARFELYRLNVNLKTLKRALVFIEDKSFFKHAGISLKSIARAFLGLLKLKPRSGGSTITQQICRTLFIVDIQKTYRRKVIEIILALWFDREVPKEDQLEIYLASVRFENGIYGILEAMDFFWDKRVPSPSRAQAFFLIERVSNINSRLLAGKIIAATKNALKEKILTRDDIDELLDIYGRAIKNNKIKADPISFEKFRNSLLKSV